MCEVYTVLRTLCIENYDTVINAIEKHSFVLNKANNGEWTDVLYKELTETNNIWFM